MSARQRRPQSREGCGPSCRTWCTTSRREVGARSKRMTSCTKLVGQLNESQRERGACTCKQDEGRTRSGRGKTYRVKIFEAKGWEEVQVGHTLPLVFIPSNITCLNKIWRELILQRSVLCFLKVKWHLILWWVGSISPAQLYKLCLTLHLKHEQDSNTHYLINLGN